MVKTPGAWASVRKSRDEPERGLLLAVAGGLATNALGIVQFMSPNANWYCMTLAVILAWWLMARPQGPSRLVGAGIILGTLTLFRHLTGIWVAMAVIVLALLERSTDARGRQLVLMRLQIAIMLAAVVGYLYWNPDTEPGGVLFMGVWPVAVLGWMLFNSRTRNRDVAIAVGLLLAGTLIPTIPFVLYHLVHGSLGVLVHDLVVVASGELDLERSGVRRVAARRPHGLDGEREHRLRNDSRGDRDGPGQPGQ